MSHLDDLTPHEKQMLADIEDPPTRLAGIGHVVREQDAAIKALVRAVERLEAKWQRKADEPTFDHFDRLVCDTYADRARDLRALLAATAPTPGEVGLRACRANRRCDRCTAEESGLGSSALCVCGPNVPCWFCGQGVPTPDEVRQADAEFILAENAAIDRAEFGTDIDGRASGGQS